jgi:hypothetical protein
MSVYPSALVLPGRALADWSSSLASRTPQRNRNEMGETTVNKTWRKLANPKKIKRLENAHCVQDAMDVERSGPKPLSSRWRIAHLGAGSATDVSAVATVLTAQTMMLPEPAANTPPASVTFRKRRRSAKLPRNFTPSAQVSA